MEKMAWHWHLNPSTPNCLLTNAFLIIPVINVSYRTIRLISHMQSKDHLEQGKKKGEGEMKGLQESVSSIMYDKRTMQK